MYSSIFLCVFDNQMIAINFIYLNELLYIILPYIIPYILHYNTLFWYITHLSLISLIQASTRILN